MTPVTHYQSDNIHLLTLRHGPATTFRRQTFPSASVSLLWWRQCVEAALGWRCANGERVHSPTHPFPVLSRSITVERWGWEPQSLPTPTPAAAPSAAASHCLSLCLYLHPSIQTSYKNETVQRRHSPVRASCQKADTANIQPQSSEFLIHICITRFEVNEGGDEVRGLNNFYFNMYVVCIDLKMPNHVTKASWFPHCVHKSCVPT